MTALLSVSVNVLGGGKVVVFLQEDVMRVETGSGVMTVIGRHKAETPTNLGLGSEKG